MSQSILPQLAQAVENCCLNLEGGGLTRQQKLDHNARILKIIKTNPSVLDKVPAERLLHALRAPAGDTDSVVRSGALRLIRYVTSDSSAVQHLLRVQLQLYIVRSLERDARLAHERMQALKVIRKLIETDSSLMPRCIVRGLVAIASHKEDNFRRVCLETLRELAVANTKVVAQCNGLRTLFDSVLDPSCQDLAESLILTILFVLNEPSMRKYMRQAIDLQVLLSPFTDTDFPNGNERRQRWTASKNAIILMMRTWTGILLLTSDPHGLSSLVQFLLKPVGQDIQRQVLSTIAEILHINLSSPSSSVVDLYSQTRTRSILQTYQHKHASSQPPHNLLDNYYVTVLVALIHCGLIEGLIALGTGTNKELAALATEILGEMLRLSSVLLPEDHCARLLAAPKLVEVASSVYPKSLDEGELGKESLEARFRALRASQMLSDLANAVGSGLNRSTLNSCGYVNGVHMSSELLMGTNRSQHRAQASSLLSSNRERMVHDLKISLDAQMDEAHLKDMINRSRVLAGKDWKKWDWEVITELLEGALTNPARLSEALRSKFFKRVSGFFRCDPGDKGYFAHLDCMPDHIPYLQPACQMYSLLLHHPEGDRFLKTDRRGKLLSEIAKALEIEARPDAEIVESHLGLMSSSEAGLNLLQESNLFTRLYAMGNMPGHDFLRRLILTNLDYTVHGPSRDLLQMWMTSGSKSLRLYATCLLRALLRADVADFKDWGVETLVTQLYQEDEVALAALSVLEEAAQNPQYLLATILKRPQKLLQLDTPAANNLRLKFLSLPEGLAFLMDMEWVSKALQEWHNFQYIAYVHKVERALVNGLNRDPRKPTNESFGQKGPVPIPVYVPRASLSAESSDAHWSLEWLFRLPWNMEVKIVGPPGSGPPSNLSLDTFVDASLVMADNYDGDDSLTDANGIRLKGVVVDARGHPKPVQIQASHILQACLYLGKCPVDRKGETRPPCRGNGDFIYSANSNYESPSSLPSHTSTTHHDTTRQSARATRQHARSHDFSTKQIGDGDSITSSMSTAISDLSLLQGIEAEEHKDWSYCRPEQRAKGPLKAPECTICAPGERALWTFEVEEGFGAVEPTVWLKSVEFTLELLPKRSPRVPLPPHLYGELAKTEAGCRLLRQSNHVPHFVHTVEDPSSVPIERRAALWALGHIGASPRGFELLRKSSSNFVETVVNLVRHSPALSLRGTCFYVLGLISRSVPGRRALMQLGWESPQDSKATISMPSDTKELFKLPEYDYQGSAAEAVESYPTSLLLPPEHEEWGDVLLQIGKLSNHIHQKEAHFALTRLKAAKPYLFKSLGLRMHVERLLECYSYRLPVRRFIHDLFDGCDLSEYSWKAIEEQAADVKRKNSTAPELQGSESMLSREHSGRIPAIYPIIEPAKTPTKEGGAAAFQLPSPHVHPNKRVTSLSRNKRYPASATIFIGAPEAMV